MHALRCQLQAKLRELCDLDGGASEASFSSGASARSSQESDGITHAILPSGRGFGVVREFCIIRYIVSSVISYHPLYRMTGGVFFLA